MTYKSDFLRTLEERGFLYQLSDAEGLDKKLCEGPVTGYIGFDATAKSLHVGNLVQIMLLYWLQKTGNKPLVLMGGGTSMVGDPSGKDEMRQMMTPEIIEDNKSNIREIFSGLLEFGDGETDAQMLDNAEWLMKLNYVEFLRDVGSKISINQMLTRESVKQRLDREQSLSFLEFNYMILQGYDFAELNKRYGCTLQMGGSDQWGNIISGVDLARRLNGAECFAVTTPLITKSDGSKMGKSVAGAVWLRKEMLPVYDYWQFWRNTGDADVAKFAKLFTTLSLDEIARWDGLEGNELNDVKKQLATAATAMIHGQAAAEEAAETARRTFEEGAIDLTLPTVEVTKAELNEGVGILSAFVTAGLAGSNGEARRLIKSGALKVNDEKVDDERATLGEGQLLPEGVIKLSAGKKRHILLKPAE
ncbi:tyrosine--tRNA ligase [Maritalea myrionectae]|uniref:Tyrosine--tRNA ligase n=1 Tax=Maritalea myrionectae TaxID=454601 RepID=A0A2R4MEX1_9HYPH|nr:tyrosine--tRNA ligase [Maritalea myrionectae]AVX04523.1 tyrosine--tRNA ligase [Maritalea myrionectae]